MSRRARRNHTPAFKAKVAQSRATGRWLSWRSNSTSIPIRSHRGKRSLRAGPPMCSVRGAAAQRRRYPPST